MPIGMQLVGRSLDEQTLLQIGHAYQRATDWHSRIPPLTERAVSVDAAPAGGARPSPNFTRKRAAALGLTYIEDDDWDGISASIAPMLQQLESARSMLSQSDAPSVRPAPVIGARSRR